MILRIRARAAVALLVVQVPVHSAKRLLRNNGVTTGASTSNARGLRPLESTQLRILAAGEESLGSANGVCHMPGSFLGVGNVDCLHENLGTAIFLLAIIIVVSVLFERTIRGVRRAIKCSQLKKIVNRIFEEVMIMGFISMVIFTLNTSGLMTKLHFQFNGKLSSSERLHFYEFFHYIVFLTMIYFILIVLLLLFVGTVVPKLIWEIKNTADDDDDSESEEDTENQDLCGEEDDHTFDTTGFSSDERASRREAPSVLSTNRRSNRPRVRTHSGMDLVQGSRAYSLLLQRYQREGWCFRFNIKKQWQLWKSFEILAYNICQHRSGYIYKNPDEMERLFGVVPKTHRDGTLKLMSYNQYHVLCMRNLLYNISHLHFSAFFLLLVIAVVPVLYPDYDHYIFIGVGVVLLLVNLVIFFKVLQILRGIVDDRLHVITSRDIQQRMHRSRSPDEAKKAPPSFRVVAHAVRAMIRMQMSALCHQQLHFHNDRFWFNSPRFLLRLFHFATIGQAFYLVWFSLVEWQTVASSDLGTYLIPLMVFLPFVALCVITPMTMPSLVLVMSLTGIFVDLNGKDPETGYGPTQTETKTRIRLMRRSFLKSHYSDTDRGTPPLTPRERAQRTLGELVSPSSVFLRIYDSPTAAAQHGKLSESASPRRTFSDREREHDTGPLLVHRSVSGGGPIGMRRSEELRENTRTRRSFDLSSYHAHSTPAHETHRKASLDIGLKRFSPRPARTESPSGTEAPAADTASTPKSPAFKNYCSKYGGYPDA